jgi:hypothetical protein
MASVGGQSKSARSFRSYFAETERCDQNYVAVASRRRWFCRVSGSAIFEAYWCRNIGAKACIVLATSRSAMGRPSCNRHWRCPSTRGKGSYWRTMLAGNASELVVAKAYPKISAEVRHIFARQTVCSVVRSILPIGQSARTPLLPETKRCESLVCPC